MGHFSTGTDYRGPASDLGKSSESEQKGSGVSRVGVSDVKHKGDTKDERKEDYRGPAAKLKQE